MSVTLEADAIVLSGACGIEDVEILVGALERERDFPVDFAAATSIHTALWQALMVFRPAIFASPMSFLMENGLLLAVVGDGENGKT